MEKTMKILYGEDVNPECYMVRQLRDLKSALEKLDESELKELKRVYEKRTEHWNAAKPQLTYGGGTAAACEDGCAFLI